MCDLREYIYGKNPGDEIILSFIRNSKNYQVKIILGRKN